MSSESPPPDRTNTTLQANISPRLNLHPCVGLSPDRMDPRITADRIALLGWVHPNRDRTVKPRINCNILYYVYIL
jgi:hypothetical protein